MQMEAVEIFKAVSSPFLCFFIPDGTYVAAGLDFKCGGSSCRPQIGMRCHAARTLRYRARRDPPPRYLQLAHTRAPARAERAPIPAVRSGSPRCLRSHGPTASHGQADPAATEAVFSAQRCERDSPNPQLSHGRSHLVMPNPSASQPSPSLRRRTRAPSHAEHRHPRALAAVCRSTGPVTQRTSTGHIRGMRGSEALSLVHPSTQGETSPKP